MKISIQNLKPGVTRYTETISPDFIERDFEEFYPYDFDIDVLLDKIDKDFRVKFTLRTYANFTCDRCLREFKKSINLELEQIFKTSSVSEITDEDTVNLPLDAIEIDLSDLLNETIVINHPIKMLCSNDCKGLCVKCGADLNENKCQCADSDVDPRWEKLRKLIK